MPHLIAVLGTLHGLFRRREGNIAMLFGLSLIPVVIAAGMAIDMTRAYSVKTRLGAALDAAGLAVGASPGLTQAQMQQRLNAYFAANYPATALGTTSNLVMTTDQSGNIITVSAQAQVNTTFMRVIGIDQMTVQSSSQITKAAGLELALALDNTGSMLANNDIGALQQASVQLVNILFSATSDANNLKISVVPFVTTVNPGTIAPSLLTANPAPGQPWFPPGTPFNATAPDNESSPQWKGCLAEPTYPADISESTSTWPGPFWWQSAADNFWQTSARTTNIWITHTNPGSTNSNDCNNSRSPNLGCPTPITRLTSDQTTLLNALNGMQAWCRSGTQIHLGLVWGWRTISPNGVFKNDTLPYGTPGWKKALVLMTDGQDNLNAPCNSPPTTPSSSFNCPPGDEMVSSGSKWNSNPPQKVDPYLSDYGPYGRIDGHMIGKGVPDPNNNNLPSPGATSQTQARLLVDNEVTLACDAIKAKGVTVYTIAFTARAQNSIPILQNCATDLGKFFNAPSQTDLQNAFVEIAQSLNVLRLSK